ncbi:MAG: Stk1 family PASTA domain-containing Ser/Thr kinase [Ruminococcaceae bacterium]|nr:Stk1 family PASTA domain-containing Ser/Thr kinase [Oscillospiraceae bacterium]
MDQYIGKLLDNRYEILELIGSGGMSNVYKAKCHRLNRMVAVKILKSDLADREDFRRRFQDESQAVAQLSHANIVSVYDVSCSGDVEYIVMELIDGITLKQYMERRGQMDWREALHFISQILRGISHAHSRGIIHRDIKPQNIMILRDGSVKVADFGIACLANAGQTLTQEALGSVHYISPEQARGDRTDARSDIYSSGVVLYEMLTGRLPFEGDSAVSVAIQHLSSIPLAPRDINADVPEALELICMKAMNSNPEKRYNSAEEMIEDLEKFRKDPTVDMEYIRADLAEKKDEQPTQPIAVDEINAVVKNRNLLRDDGEAVPISNKEKKKMGIIIGAFAGAMLIIFLLFQLIFSGFSDGDTDKDGYVVPNVLGKTVEEAQQMQGVKGIFTIEVIGSRVDKSYQPGQIIQQDPTAGRTRKNNLKIQVYVCVEEEKESMPNLLGIGEQAAKVKLKNLNLDLIIQVKEEFSTEQGAGLIIKTKPSVGETIKKGDIVMLVISKGPEIKKVTVPDFLGMELDEAALGAESLNLAVGSHQYENSDKPKGTVIKQSLKATTEVDEGTEIVFTVSNGPAVSKVTVPNFEGKDESAAASEAKNLGLKVGTTKYEFSNTEEGTVLKQSVAANTEVDQGTEIVFTVSKGPEEPAQVTNPVTFAVPDAITGDNVRVDFLLDDEIVGGRYFNADNERSVSNNFTGLKGQTYTVKAVFNNGAASAVQEITF